MEYRSLIELLWYTAILSLVKSKPILGSLQMKLKIFSQRLRRFIPAIFFRTPIDILDRAVTTGTDWKLLKLEGQTAFIDLNDY